MCGRCEVISLCIYDKFSAVLSLSCCWSCDVQTLTFIYLVCHCYNVQQDTYLVTPVNLGCFRLRKLMYLFNFHILKIFY